MTWEFKSEHCIGKLKQCATIIEYLWQVCSNTNNFPVIIMKPIYEIVWPNFWKPLLQRQQTVETVFNLEATFTAAIARCSDKYSHCQHKLQLRCGPKHTWLEGCRARNNEIKYRNTNWIESDWLCLSYCICLVALTPPPSTSQSVRYGLQHHKRSMFSVVAGWKEVTANDFKTP